MARDFHREGLCEALDAEIGRVVAAVLGLPRLRGDGGQVDDALPSLADHDGHDALTEQERPCQLDGDNAEPATGGPAAIMRR